jgi:23S rRNA (uracil1939-C5)-methyltransferase
MQLSMKKEIVLDCFARIGKIKELLPIEIAASPELGYRQRAQFKVDSVKKSLGFYKRKSQEVVAIHHCPLLRPALNDMLGHGNDIIALLSSHVDQIKLIEGNQSITSSPVLPGFTSKTTTILVPPFSFIVSGDGFFQGNAFLCEKMGNWVKQLIQGEYFIELYGGVGFFSVFLHDRFKKGVTVEAMESQVALSETNLKKNGISNISAIVATAEDYLDRIKNISYPIDSIIVDPPRTGLSQKAREGIRRCKPLTILYISCNPSTHSRDVGFFVNNGEYRIDAMELFDLYPNTHHIESMVLLRRG